MKPLAIAPMLALLGAAPNSTMWTDVYPPERFRGPAVAVVAFVPPEAIDSLCGEPGGKPPPGTRIVACSWMGKDGIGRIVLPMPSVTEPEKFHRLAEHEIAHLRHWPGSHGD